jgi:aconitate hydratase
MTCRRRRCCRATATSKAASPGRAANYLASPPLVVAYALAGTVNIDLTTDPIGEDKDGNPSTSRTSGRPKEIAGVHHEERHPRGSRRPNTPTCSRATRSGRQDRGDEAADLRLGRQSSTYMQNPPYFEGHGQDGAGHDLRHRGRPRARSFGDMITTDHISPAGAIKAESPAGEVPDQARQSVPRDFNSYGSRRGNHEVMMRGTFANIRHQEPDAGPGRGRLHLPLSDGRRQAIYDAAMQYQGRRAAGDLRRRNTAMARRATGRPRAPTCWASRR